MLCNAIEIKGPFNSEIVFNKMYWKVFGSTRFRNKKKTITIAVQK